MTSWMAYAAVAGALLAAPLSVASAAVGDAPRPTEEDASRLALVAQEKLAAARMAGLRFRVRVLQPQLSVRTADPYHPATYRAGSFRDVRVPFGDATYRARLDLEVAIADETGATLGCRTFTGRSSKVVRFPAPHHYRTFDSIHEIGRRHVSCSHYADTGTLLARALHDALEGDEGAMRWVASLRH